VTKNSEGYLNGWHQKQLPLVVVVLVVVACLWVSHSEDDDIACVFR